MLVGFETGDDAAVYRISDDVALVLTVDFFAPVVDDPYDYGAIAAANALSDVYAIGGKPLSALNLAAVPSDLPVPVVARVLEGGAAKASEAGVSIVGGHTIVDKEPKYGLSVTGIVKPGEQVTNSSARAGDLLVLAKPIGTGIITTAGKNQRADPRVMAGAVEVMLSLNRGASEAMVAVGVSACTDISGFGLLGHLHEMVSASAVSARVSRRAVPLLHGVLELLSAGIAPGGTHRNLEFLAGSVSWDRSLTDQDRLLLCDAQTSGGLLLSVPADRLGALTERLRANGVTDHAVVGEIVESSGVAIQVTA